MFLKEVQCSGVIKRKYVVKSKRANDDNCNKQWVRSESIFNGHIIGERTLSDGSNEWMGEDEGIIYQPERYFKAFLVVYSIHRSPVYVLPEDVKIIE